MRISSKTALALAVAMIVAGIKDVPRAWARALDQAHRDACSGLDGVLPGLLSRIDDVLIAVPTVPAEEAAYLKSEHDAAMANKSSAERDRLIMARPYYYIWSFRDDLTKARGEIAEAIDKERTNANPAVRIYTISSFITTANRLQQDFSDVISHFLPALLNERQAARLESGLDEIPVIVSRYIWCEAWILEPD
ncbi:MAG: hypothetical protein J2P47_10715 [Acetobacteraceae bacterium]|nr:hypothetical protein [Acetobacteraceae bacterium]